MTLKIYTFKIKGSGSDGQSWETNGKVACEFHYCFDNAMAETFKQLTNSRAIYGKPGLGCRGPYDIHSVVIEQEKH